MLIKVVILANELMIFSMDLVKRNLKMGLCIMGSMFRGRSMVRGSSSFRMGVIIKGSSRRTSSMGRENTLGPTNISTKVNG